MESQSAAQRNAKATIAPTSPRSGAGLAIWALALSVSAFAGCCNPKGFILRGDWSVEMNRLPWLAGHGAEYEAASDEECDDPREAARKRHSARGEEIKTPQPDKEPAQASPGVPAPAEHQPGEHPPGEIEEEADHPDGDEQASAVMAAPVRFHPVPTRPVFVRRVVRRAKSQAESAEELPEAESREAEPIGEARASDAPAARRVARPNQRVRLKRRRTSGE